MDVSLFEKLTLLTLNKTFSIHGSKIVITVKDYL